MDIESSPVGLEIQEKNEVEREREQSGLIDPLSPPSAFPYGRTACGEGLGTAAANFWRARTAGLGRLDSSVGPLQAT